MLDQNLKIKAADKKGLIMIALGWLILSMALDAVIDQANPVALSHVVLFWTLGMGNLLALAKTTQCLIAWKTGSQPLYETLFWGLMKASLLLAIMGALWFTRHAYIFANLAGLSILVMMPIAGGSVVSVGVSKHA